LSIVDPGSSKIPPALEEKIAQAIAREMKKNNIDKSVLEFLLSKEGISLPDGVDLLFEELKGAGDAIRGPRCSICGTHPELKDRKQCPDCKRYLCEKCSQEICKCGRAAEIPEIEHLREALWMGTGVYGIYSPQLVFLYLMTRDPLALTYFAISLVSLCVYLVHERKFPWTSILRQLALA
jgi:hypothetical protein